MRPTSRYGGGVERPPEAGRGDDGRADAAPAPDDGADPGGGRAADCDAAVAATVDDADDADDGTDPLRFRRWMRSSSTGAVLTGIALGLQHALEEHREQPAFVVEAPGEPEDPDAPITLHFDPDDPTRTVAVVRSPRPEGAADAPTGGGGGRQDDDGPD